MARIADESEIKIALAGNEWRVGYCRDGSQRGAYLLLWPLGEQLWDLEFHPKLPFDGDSGEEIYLISSHDDAAISELVRAQIEWAPTREAAERAALDYFPRSRVAEAVRNAEGLHSAPLAPIPKSVDGGSVSANPWRSS